VASVLLFTGGCSNKPLVGIGTPESRAQAATLVRDRELELTALRAEMAATRIAAAKKEAELQELRDLVQQLRLENAESRQAFLDLRERGEQRQTEVEKGRNEQDRLSQSQTTQHLAMLKDTVVTLAQELGQLRQELVRPVAKERSKPSKPTPSKSGEPSSLDLRSDPPQRMPSARQNSAPSSAVSPVALTVTNDVMSGPPSTITVQPGDTLWGLAKRTRTSLSRLRELNQLEGDALNVGQVLVSQPVTSPKQP
jgi:LysM repeat protein